MKYVIWGAGERGERVFSHLDKAEVFAFIDSNTTKVGQSFCGKKIISLEEYERNYKECYIIISYSHEDEITRVLKSRGINRYFLLTECPGEFQEPNPRDCLKNYILRYVEKRKRYALYGCTLYSLVLWKWLKDDLGIAVPIVIPQKVDCDIEGLREMVPEAAFIEACQFQGEADEILVTVEQDLEKVKNSYTQCIVTNVYDCSDRIDEYYNPQIEKFKGIHTNDKRCFIVATGPSLRIEDLNMLAEHKEICIGVNSICRAFQDTVWRPTYYIAMDYRALRDWGDLMQDAGVPYLFLGDTYKKFWMQKRSEKNIKHHLAYEYNEKRMPKFSTDFSRKSYMGSTVTYNALQLAAYLGFQEIYLLGVDFSYFGHSDKDMPYTHFYPEKSLTSKGYEKQVYLAYQAAQKYAQEHGISIYNASRGGKLDVFERVDLDEVLRDGGEA